MIRKLILLICFVFIKTHESIETVHIENITSLTFYSNRMTKSYRTKSQPQLICTGGNAKSEQYEVTVVQCVKTGSNGNQTQWNCKSDLPDHIRLGETNPSCEGYSNPQDPYKILESCNLYYTLNRNNDSTWLFVFFIGIFIYTLYKICNSTNLSNQRHYENNDTSSFIGGAIVGYALTSLYNRNDKKSYSSNGYGSFIEK